MSAVMIRTLIATVLVFMVTLAYISGLGYYLQSGTHQMLVGTESINNNNSMSLQSTTESSKLNVERNKTFFVRDYKMNDGHRLGNQMFRYASMLGIARAQGRELIITPGSDLEKTFKLQHVAINEASKEWAVISEANALSFDTGLMKLPPANVRIFGYLQSYKYFAQIADEVRHEFTFHDSVAKEASTILYKAYTKLDGSLVIGVHNRRGDFTTERNKLLGYVIPDKSYFSKAFNLFKSKFPGRNITFLVVSDDLNWCKENLVGDNIIIAPPASTAVHIAVLASCDHVIITSGTYSWWSGWLSGGDVVYFTGYLQKNTTFGKVFSPQDYYPSEWSGLGN